MSTIKTRLDNLQAAHNLKNLRKSGGHLVDHVENVRLMLERLDGIPETGAIPGEGLHDEMVRRLQVAEGYDLSLMPGDTLREKVNAVDLVCGGKLWVPDAARHAARFVFEMYEFLY